jgi:signal transduction histidine kinase
MVAGRMHQRENGRRLVARFGFCLLFVALLPTPNAAEEAQRRFLLIYSAHSTLVANTEATAGAAAAFDRALDAGYEVYAEYRDDQRFPGPHADRAFAEEMQRKYAGQDFDAILTFGRAALDYAVEHRGELGIAAPVVFGGVTDSTLAGVELPADVHGVSSRYSVSGTLALARRLQPDARRVVVMTGSGPFDRSWAERAASELAGAPDLAIESVSGLTLEGFQEVAAGLGRDTILIVLTVYEDAAGRQFTPLNAAELIAGASGAPSWSVYDTFIGRGVVGGEVQRFREIGAAMAGQALRLIDGDEAVEPMHDAPTRPVVDWRRVRDFGLDRDLLPANAVLEFYDPSAWERYRWQILLASAVILAQSATIAALAVQGRRRRTAEKEVVARREELAHMSRVAQLGELSGALAHELNQPLTSILANAEAGAQLAARDPVDLEEISAILADIAEDDRRAASIIVELRRLMAKGETELETLDLNRVVVEVIRIVQSELLVRQVTVDRQLARAPLPVRANRAQIKQVLLNLMLNAADAMADQPAGSRVVTVSTSPRDDGWRELAVRDQGPGLAAEVAADPFRPFATTKAHGLGLGLSICRTIVQAHGGTLAFDDTVRRGARVVLALPPP